MAKQKTELSEKHWKALKLAEEGSLNIGEICKEMGWDEKYYYNLRTGNIEGAGYISELFSREYKKIEGKRDQTIKTLVKENTVAAQELIKRTLAELKSRKLLTLDENKLLGTLTNALGKHSPVVSKAGSSYNYVKALTSEDLLREFKRLKAIAEQSFDRSSPSPSE